MKYLPVALVVLVALTACQSQEPTGNSIMENVQAQSELGEQLAQQDAPEMGWMDYEITDVQSGESFTIASLDAPVLVKNFAVWCPKCKQQHEELKGYDGTVISLNIDPNEDEDVVREYAAESGYEWIFAVAPQEMTASLVSEFGPKIISTPTTPVVLVCEDGTRYLPDGFKPVETLEDEIAAGC